MIPDLGGLKSACQPNLTGIKVCELASSDTLSTLSAAAALSRTSSDTLTAPTAAATGAPGAAAYILRGYGMLMSDVLSIDEIGEGHHGYREGHHGLGEAGEGHCTGTGGHGGNRRHTECSRAMPGISACLLHIFTLLRRQLTFVPSS